MSVKIATIEDLPYVIELVLKFKNNSPYKDLLVEVSKVNSMLRSIIEGDKDKSIILLSYYDAEGGVQSAPVGMLIGTSSEFLFSTQKHATELAWWIEPEYRKSFLGQELLDAFFFWAEKINCNYIHLSNLEDHTSSKMRKLYEHLGFRPMEQAWIKELPHKGSGEEI